MGENFVKPSEDDLLPQILTKPATVPSRPLGFGEAHQLFGTRQKIEQHLTLRGEVAFAVRNERGAGDSVGYVLQRIGGLESQKISNRRSSKRSHSRTVPFPLLWISEYLL